jgi:hypothetical protein
LLQTLYRAFATKRVETPDGFGNILLANFGNVRSKRTNALEAVPDVKILLSNALFVNMNVENHKLGSQCGHGNCTQFRAR